ncbi:hypothetical protein PFICI_00553 [Pestalotiopsis fici W106-1]|uniref:Amidase domain-containing protein n=1 Tax=Pestalotiopsis fici (strain W106-1 / CGMCC3.15140) TaxID=1229662 RepID=W3XL80_PESFW|nr:uncharacterized protein PFICI_00553 [Pestalotiopsis fici W106-1]ETS86725.1 hypothetical protein PFICI_00553 [Pestalotiopsis fici W106-1]
MATSGCNPTHLNLVEATIRELQYALEIGAITSVELVSLYLHRIGKFDCQGPRLNSVCVLNPNVFDEAQRSDDYRASGKPPRALEGIPFTVKDSFMVKGMTVAAGSPAFRDLVSSEDAAIVTFLRDAGAIVLGKTNMPAMADGGSQRGLYGRAESPYNQTYSTTACASGSSNGCGTSTAASLAAFGFAGETVSSGRSPASNNALVGYSPSRGVIPNRGQWPLYPTCDVIVPHTRSMRDLFDVLNVIVSDDVQSARGIDFWRNNPVVSIPKSSDTRPADYSGLEDANALSGKRIGVPRCFLGHADAKPSHFIHEDVLALWREAKAALEALGATVVETEFPLLEQYAKQDFPGQGCNVPGMTEAWVGIERCQMIATAWDDFLRNNQSPQYPNLAAANPDEIHPHIAPMDDASRFSEVQNQVRYSDMIKAVRDRKEKTLYSFAGMDEALPALENMRKKTLELWMDAQDIDLLAFPTNGDVAYADADESFQSMQHALQDGIKYSNGGRALKHLGVPCITLPMGLMASKQMPLGITFATKAYADNDLLRYAYAYETISRKRTAPLLAPALSTDLILLHQNLFVMAKEKPIMDVTSATWEKTQTTEFEVRKVSIECMLYSSAPAEEVCSFRVFVNGDEHGNPIRRDGDRWKWNAQLSRPRVFERYPTIAKVPKDHFLVVLVSKLESGRAAGSMVLID